MDPTGGKHAKQKHMDGSPGVPVSAAVGMIYRRPGQVPTTADQGDGGRGREMQVTPAMLAPFPASRGRRLFTCRLQVAVAGPVNTAGGPVGVAQPSHLSGGVKATVMASQPMLISCLIPSG